MIVEEGRQIPLARYGCISVTRNLPNFGENIYVPGYGDDDKNNKIYTNTQQFSEGVYQGTMENDLVIKHDGYSKLHMSGSPILIAGSSTAIGIHAFTYCIERGYNGGSGFYSEEFWNAMGYAESTLDQRLHNGDQIEKIGHWKNNQFEEKDPGESFTCKIDETETFRAYQNISHEEKYNNWNNSSNVGIPSVNYTFNRPDFLLKFNAKSIKTKLRRKP